MKKFNHLNFTVINLHHVNIKVGSLFLLFKSIILNNTSL